MDTKSFLARVSSPTDELVICTHRPDDSGKNPRGFFWNRGSFADLDTAVAAIQRWDALQHTTVYYTIGRFAGHGYTNDKGKPAFNRFKHLATSFKTLALDLDIGPDKPYATQRDGWVAMQKALATFGFPPPMVVSSGRGIHCYWPLTVPISPEHWEKASTALRLALEDGGVVIDTSKIHDRSMVLRPVGTHHKKDTPWKPVALVADSPDFDPVDLFGLLKPWFSRVPAPSRQGAPRVSSLMDDLKGDGDIVYEAVAGKCAQIGALLASGGVTDAGGQPVSYAMWTHMVQFAGRCVDPPAAITALGGQHAKFDLQEAIDKKGSFGRGVPFCTTFELACTAGCATCLYKGKISNPGQLSHQLVVEQPPGVGTVELPHGYVVNAGKIWTEEIRDVLVLQADGKKVKQTVKDRVLACPYEIHVTGVFTDHDYSTSTATISVKYPLGNWQHHDLPLSMLSTSGKEFSDYLINKQIFVVGAQTLDRTRTFIMRYLEKVQQQSPTGADFVSFGWQPDGSFLCGEHLIGSPTGNTSRRLKGAAARYTDIIKPSGSRAEWVRATKLLDTPGANNIAAAILTACIGSLGDAPGNSSFIWSMYSSETTTGKTLSLLAANSVHGHPPSLLMNVMDTSNAVYKVRGTLNNLVGTMDEVTTLASALAVEFCYNMSQGREKLSLTKDREVREPVTWHGPTMVTCNVSMYDKYDEVMSQNDPVKARTLEFEQHDNSFVLVHGTEFYELITNNFGFALPEIVQYIIDNGGRKAVWEAAVREYDRRFSFRFEPAERYRRTAIIGAWLMGIIGRKLGLIAFDVDRVANHMLDRVVQLRVRAKNETLDAFDILGQFLQENHDALILAREEYAPGGKGRENVQYPLPQRAVARLNVVYDSANPVMPGSKLIINQIALKKWLAKSRDSLQRITGELQVAGAMIADRERVTLYKGCQNDNPGQAICLVLNANHPRFAGAITGAKAHQTSPVTLAIVGGTTP